MKWKIIMILLAVSMIAGCVSENPDTNSTSASISGDVENTAEAGVPIDSILFMRTGALISMGNDEEVSTINVYDGGKQLVSQSVGERVKEVFAGFDWDQNVKYRFEVVADNNAVSTLDVYAPAKPALLNVDTIELEDVEPGEICKTTNNVEGVLKFSPDGRYLCIGTHNGHLRIINVVEGNEIFDEKISEGNIMCMEFSPDSSSLYVTEKSIDGFIYCFDINGTQRWKFRIADDLGSDLKYMPSVRKVVFDSDGNVYAAGSRYCGWVSGTFKYSARVYSLDPEGNLLWKFPDSENMDSGVSWIDATPDGEYVVFSTANFGKSEKWKDGTVHVLNGESGEELWNYKIPPLEPYFKSVSVWYSTTITPDGNYVTSLASDGRGYLFNNKEILQTGNSEPVWQKNISTPITVSGIPIYGSANYGYNVNDSIIFSVGSTFSKAKDKDAPIEHPGGNSLYVYDLDGNLLWKWRVEGYTGELGIADPYLVAPISQNLVTNNLDVHGVYVFDMSKNGGATSKLVNVYRTEGITIAADISPDGRYIAAFEAPARLEDGSVIGDYKVHILN
ncbi:PQQ-like domain-containing protein [Methanococcoides vulcani]|uniref:PQQ-like domain-containing protein n=1 Tax=Methanococcoides vulcani TaxID=1353158 RepID=A0A1H9YIS2_9EURY|nr:WD40 repeat domain-containing protein [Methanococcoides vulcani]SES68884.1 PQQ-like domain-containing protein [Methanococcoides vulcani]